MIDDFCRKWDATKIRLNNSIGWVSNRMECPELLVKRISGSCLAENKRIKSHKKLWGCWFEMSEEDVETCFPESSHLPRD